MPRLPHWFYPLAFASVITAMIFAVGAPSMSEASPCQQILLPGYFYPSVLWQRAALAQGAWMIVNPASGSGTTISSDYARSVASIQAAGLKAIGYVSTRYANRPIDEVRADIERYYTWYHVDGIFLDEVPTDPSHLTYYQDLAASIRAHNGSVVVLNPGTVPDQKYIGVGDSTVVFEGNYTEYVKERFPTWMSTYPSSKLAHLIYRTPSKYLKDVLRRSRSQNAGFVYVTNDVLPNPWDTLPPYWTSEKDLVASSCSH